MTKDEVYIKELTLSNVKCFKGTHNISLAKPNGEPQQWNVILGNNNTGKTTILKVLASLFPIWEDDSYFVPRSNISLEINNFFKFSILFGDRRLSFDWGIEQIKGNDTHSFFFKPAITKKTHDENTIKLFESFFSIGYGISRKISESALSNNEQKEDSIDGIFKDDVRYTNPEEWLFQLELSASKGDKNAKNLFNQVKNIITSDLLPDVHDVELISKTVGNSVQNYALFDTDYGKVRLRELGYGYQSTMVWVVDLAKKMFEHFYKLENPLTGSAICLVDEIDLHLHPDWQRKIIKYLTGVFPNVQFIVTAHSPLIVQSAEDVNLIILEKDEENIHIRQEFGTFQGWTVEEILQDLMGLGEKTLSDKYLNLLKKFEKSIDDENYETAKTAYEGLLEILHPTSSKRKLLKLQLGSIAPKIETLAFA